jgi:hypothetical protein
MENEFYQSTIREYEEIFARLAHPFADEKQRPGRGNNTFKYIDQYQVMNRLDDVVGPANWSCEHIESNTGVCCRITITLPDGRTVSRDGASGFDVRKGKEKEDRAPSMVVKTAYAESLKKAAEAFGIGRYLKGRTPKYYGRVVADHLKRAGARSNDRDQGPLQGKTSEPPSEEEFPARMPRAKRPGSELFRLLSGGKYAQQKMVYRANEFGIQNGFPARIVDWSREQVLAFCGAYEIPLRDDTVEPGAAGPSPDLEAVQELAAEILGADRGDE